MILSGLLDLPTSPDAPFDPYRSLFACLLLAHLVRNSEHAKKLAREISVPPLDAEDGDDEKVGLVQLIVGNLMMAAREQTECVNRAAKEGRVEGSTEEEDWTRVMVGYLVLLCSWLWDSPKTVKEFLSESANLQVVSKALGRLDQADVVAHPAYHPNDRYRPISARPQRFLAWSMLRVQPRTGRDHTVDSAPHSSLSYRSRPVCFPNGKVTRRSEVQSGATGCV